MEDEPTYAELKAEIKRLKAKEKYMMLRLTSAVSDRKAALDENKQLWINNQSIKDTYEQYISDLGKEPDEDIVPQVNFKKRTTVIGRRYSHI